MTDYKERDDEVKEEMKKESYELDTSQGDFTTIAIGILLSLAIFFIVPTLLHIRLGDLHPIFVIGGFVLLTVFFWSIAEKIKHHND